MFFANLWKVVIVQRYDFFAKLREGFSDVWKNGFWDVRWLRQAQPPWKVKFVD